MLKRLFDIIVTSLGLIILLPVIVVVALQVRRKLGAPIFFRQIRPGLNGKPFEMIKFRTMLDTYDKNGNPLSDTERITPFGRFLRSTSLDELPGLWNVLRGEMSLVGPRPLSTTYLTLYSPEQARRHAVKPGITGWAQINGRNSITWKKKFEMDVWYVNHQNLILDIKILFLTIKKVLARNDVQEGGQDQVESFNGKN